jgi:aryl-alcohol dehydrogenase-like predicted oxidoreductase
MQYRTHRGLAISEIGVGCYALGGVYGQVDQREFHAMLRRAYELGVSFFDTAEAYGDGERLLGEALLPFRQQVLIATKVGVKEGAKPDLSPGYIRRACDASLQALGTDYIDLYQVHFDDPHTPVQETAGVLDDLVAAGKIRRYGLGHLPLEKVTAYFENGKVFSILMELSAAERTSLHTLLPLCRERGAAAIAFSATGRGLLTGRFQEGHTFPPSDLRHMDPLFQRERFHSGLRIAARLAEIAGKYGRTPAQAALAWVLSRPGIVCALSGPSSITHLEENTRASGWSFHTPDLEALDAFLDQEAIWLKRQQRISLEHILAGSLPEASAAFVDLVYVIETALALELAQEGQVLPLFYELYALRKTLDRPGALDKLDGIRQELSRLIQLNSHELGEVGRI